MTKDADNTRPLHTDCYTQNWVACLDRRFQAVDNVGEDRLPSPTSGGCTELSDSEWPAYCVDMSFTVPATPKLLRSRNLADDNEGFYARYVRRFLTRF
jgi:hypothetical protein